MPLREYGAAWSSDGGRIAYLEYDQRLIYTMRADGTDVGPLTYQPRLHGVPAWQTLPNKHNHRGG